MERGKDGIIEGAKPRLLHADMSTISSIIFQKAGKALEPKGVKMLDAPVSGGEQGVPPPMTSAVQELFSALRVKGRGGLDHSGVITLLEDLAGLGE